MKKFLLQILTTAAGFFLAISLIVLFCVFSLIGLSGSDTPNVGDHALLCIDLSGALEERTGSTPLSELTGQGESGPGLDELLRSIQKAKTNKDIQGIYLEAGLLSASPACLQELRQALADFRKSGKKIIAYGDVYTQGCYYVCSVADRVFLNPAGNLEWKGFAAQPMFYKDMLQKFGVRMQVFKVGTYKSAVEPFTNSEMSAANREQVTAYLNSIWNQVVKEVARSRRLSETELKALADSNTTFRPAKEMVEARMADELMYKKSVEKYLCRLTGAEKFDDIDLLTASDVCALPTDDSVTKKNKIAVYYAFGDVVSETGKELSGSNSICAEEVIDDLEDLTDDDRIKAVVIRVNSGGGSAYASEQIWKAVKDLRAKKPVVVSMSGMAASGAYYLSCGTDYLVADPTTLTGSIGIFGMFPDASNLLTEKLGLKFDVVKTGRHADFGAVSRPLNEAEQNMLQAYIHKGYNLFLKRVSEARKMKMEDVDKVAQGRVWTGEQAIKVGLVDELGNLNLAIERAAERAHVKKGSYSLAYYPAQKKWYEQLLDSRISGLAESRLEAELGEYYKPFMWLKTIKQRDYIQARIPYDPNIN